MPPNIGAGCWKATCDRRGMEAISSTPLLAMNHSPSVALCQCASFLVRWQKSIIRWWNFVLCFPKGLGGPLFCKPSVNIFQLFPFNLPPFHIAVFIPNVLQEERLLYQQAGVGGSWVMLSHSFIMAFKGDECSLELWPDVFKLRLKTTCPTLQKMPSLPHS